MARKSTQNPRVVPDDGHSVTTVATRRNAIVLTYSTLWLLWCLLVSLQLATATLLAFLASIYFSRNTPNSLLWTTAVYFIFTECYYDFINRFSNVLASGYALLCAAFIFSGFRLVWFSTKSRRLNFGASKGAMYQCMHQDSGLSEIARVGGLRHSLRFWFSDFNIHGVRFNQRQIASKVVSLISQTTAAHLASISISNTLLNQTYGLVIFLDGISMLRAFMAQFRAVGHPVCELAPDGLRGRGHPSRRRDLDLRITRARGDYAFPSQRRGAKFAHVLFAAYGCLVLIISLASADFFGHLCRQPQYECQYRLHLWFSTKEVCMKRTIDCAKVGISGFQDELDAALDTLHEGFLSDISFQHCDSFEMPATLGTIPTLETITIQHSWIASWPLETNLSDGIFERLTTVKLLDVDTNATLHGLVSVPLAKTVEYIRFDRVPNAAAILAPVGDNWQHLVNFDCDRCNLTVVPTAVNALHQLQTISFVDSQISPLPDEYITRWTLALIGVWMDGNPGLTELSDAVRRQAASADMFTMQRTNLSSIPEWVPSVAHPGFAVFAYGTPLCDPTKRLAAKMSAAVRAHVLCNESDNS